MLPIKQPTPFTVVSYHTSLIWVSHLKMQNTHILRWYLSLLPISFTISVGQAFTLLEYACTKSPLHHMVRKELREATSWMLPNTLMTYQMDCWKIRSLFATGEQDVSWTGRGSFISKLDSTETISLCPCWNFFSFNEISIEYYIIKLGHVRSFPVMKISSIIDYTKPWILRIDRRGD